MRILVTGSSGFLGKHVVRELKELGHAVYEYDMVGGLDVRDGIELEKWMSLVDGVVHLAGVSRVIMGDKHPLECVESNVMGSMHVLECMRESKRKPWGIFASTYTANQCDSIYTISKYSIEQVAREYNILFGVKVQVIRLPDIVGEGDNPDKAIPVITRLAKEGKDIHIYSPHQVYHIKDVRKVAGEIANMVDIIDKRGASKYFGLLEIPGDREITLWDLAQEIVKREGSLSTILED